MDKWTEIRTAYMVAKHGTVSAAAAAMGVHRATVNRHVDTIEEALGARIFIRHAKGYALTDVGENLLRVAQKTEELIEDFSGRAKGQDSQIDGEIKITVLPPFADVLMDAIITFRLENPLCTVSIIATENLEKLEFGDAHVALRAGAEPKHPDYVVKLYDKMALNLYAHKSYLDRKGCPSANHDLINHEFVIPEQASRRLPFSKWIEEHVSASQIAVSSRHEQVLKQAIFAGLGLGFLTDLDVAGRKDVQPVLSQNGPWSVPLWLVTHVDLHRTEKVQALLRCIERQRKT